MECSICFESIKKNNFLIFLKRNDIDICKNNFKCIDFLCKKCILNHTQQNIFCENNCPLCRNYKFHYLSEIYYIYSKLMSINKIIKKIKINESKNIVDRIDKIFIYLLESFDNYIKSIHINDEYIIKFYFDEIKSDIKDLKKIIIKLK